MPNDRLIPWIQDMPFRFESLQIWHQARAFSNDIARLAARLPEQERHSLASQLTRAANSISLNIAEGSGRDTDADFNRFLAIAIGSTFEVASGLFLALDRGYLTQDAHKTLYDQAEQIGKSINSFRKTLKA
jgi:four helix bundle protein